MNGQDGRGPVEEVKVLLVEDNPADAQLVRQVLRESRGAMGVWHGVLVVSWVDQLQQALDSLRRDDYGVVLLDLMLGDSRGLETLAAVRAEAVGVPIVVLTGFDDDGLALSAIQRGAQDYIAKEHLDGRLLTRTIRHAIERKRAESELLRHACQVDAARARIEHQAEELETRAKQLDRINRELDDFTYIASHDLKEPLRGIAAYCETLLEDYHDKLDADGQHRLNALVKLCGRLESLITDLLTYCRVGGTRPAETGIDLNSVVAEVLETLEPAIEQRGATVNVVDRLPVVTGDSTLIGMALSNLICNGLKFNDDPEPMVQIGCLAGDSPTLYVRDNGIGIPRKHHEVIFTIFRRLHPRRKYDGTGAGLTIVRKIVEWHGGRIWLESEPGMGSTFYLTLGSAEKPAAERPTRRPHWLRQSRAAARR